MIKMIQSLIETGIASIEDESDNQNDALFPATDILDMSSEMTQFSEDMLEEGFTASFSCKFQSPSSLMNFISELLSEPYTFDETMDGVHINITIDLSKFFTNPAQRLTEYWPKYHLANGDNRYQTYSSVYQYESETDAIFTEYYDTVIVNIPDDIIASRRMSFITLNSSYPTVEIDSTRICSPIIFVDDNGKDMNTMELLYGDPITTVSLKQYFPYFQDYTFGGIFPEMTNRQKWIDFFSNLICE